MTVDEPNRSLHIVPMAADLATENHVTGAVAGERSRRRSIPIAVLLGLSLGALVLVAAVLMGSLILTSVDTNSLTQKLIGTISWSSLQFDGGDALADDRQRA